MVSLIPRPRDLSNRRDATSTIPPPRSKPSTKTKAPSTPSTSRSTGSSQPATTRAQSSQQTVDQSPIDRRELLSSSIVTVEFLPASEASSTTHGPTSPTTKVLRHKRPVISEYVKKRRESPPESGPGSLSIQIPEELSSARPTQHRTYTESRAITSPTSPVQSPAQSRRPREIPEDLRHVFQVLTPLSEISATPSLRHDSPSIFSQISPSTVATPISIGGYSPQASQNSHFGPGYPPNSPVRKPGVVGSPAVSPDSRRAASHPQQVQRYQVQSPTDLQRKPTVYKTSSSPTAVSQPQKITDRERHLQHPANNHELDARTNPTLPAVIPELAHLEHAAAVPSTSPTKAPERPSRDGVEGLYGLPSHPLAQSVSIQEANRRLSTSQPAPAIARTRLSIKPPEKPRLIDTTVSPTSASTQSRSASTPLSASSTRSGSRIAQFFRKDKTASPVPDLDVGIQSKKGPVAGTGHEGYGRQAGKRRSTGTSSNRRISGGSASSAGIDEFLASKAAPVYIRKDDDGRLVHSDRSSGGFPGSRTSQQSSAWSSVTSQSGVPASLTASQVQLPGPPDGRLHDVRADLSRASSSRGRGSAIPGFARPRRLSKEPKRGPSAEPVSREPTPAADRKISRSRQASKPEEGKRTGLLGLFGRSKTKLSSRDMAKAKDNVMPAPQNHVLGLAQQLAASKARAHYEPPDLKDAQAGHIRPPPMEEIGQMLEEAAFTDGDDHSDVGQRPHNAHLRRPPKQSRHQPRVESEEVSLTLCPDLQRQRSTRLVNSDSRDMTRNLEIRRSLSVNSPDHRQSARNYSRPMPKMQSTKADAVEEALPSSQPLANHIQARHSRHVSLDSSVNSDLTRPQQAQTSKVDSLRQPILSASRPPSAFFKMPSRKGSEVSVSSSASSFYQPITAGIVIPHGRGAASSPDEVWHEYDELIHHLTPTDSNQSHNGLPAAKQGDYFATKPRPCADPVDIKAKSKSQFPNLGQMAASLRSDLSPFLGKEKRSPHFSGLMHPAVWDTPASPPVAALPMAPMPPPKPVESAAKPDPMANLKRRASTKAAREVVSRRIARVDNAKLGLLAPDFCKMLTFGKLLFSPAHDDLEMKADENATGPDQRVLVFDGLGKDWSLSCARRYPRAQVVVHSPGPHELAPNVRPSSPRNYRHVRHSNLAVKLPYPPSSFHTVVFRFPLATSEFSLGFALSECKRVLKPGGFLEICLLDLDLTVMGQRTRKAIKGLKTKIQETQPDVSLKPTSDYVQYLLGRYGFEDLHRCTLLPPVASPISTSPRGSLDEAGRPRRPSLGQDDLRKLGLLAPNIGRWLYSQAFEQNAQKIRAGDSIWKDAELLAECEEKDAAFKLLVCYAKRPESDKRKTQSL